MPYDTYSSLFDLLHSEWGFLGSSAGKESACSAEYPSSIPGSGSSPAEGIGYPTPVFLGYPGGSGSKESSCNVGDWGDSWVVKIPWRRASTHSDILA